jgi:hypothetical protein
MPNGAEVMACGGGTEQLTEEQMETAGRHQPAAE